MTEAAVEKQPSSKLSQNAQDLKIPMPHIYQQYLIYYRQSRRVVATQLDTAKRVLAALNDYLEKVDIKLADIKIEHIDGFLTQFNASHALGTRRLYRSCLRGFLTYLYQHRGILSKNLAPLVVGPPIFAPQKPPMFLRPHEVKQLLDSLTISTDKDLRIYAMVHLAYFLGLRPHEISLITLDDISFTKAELTLKNRKNNRQVQLPLPENVLKAITAYIVGARPKNKHRTLFLSLITPHAPICAGVVGHYLTGCLHSAGISATAYWLRHTYAQNLLEAGASIYEIKEMLGHDRIDSTRKYLSIHIQLMRKVLFDETL
ncbi:MAG: tyrosine-type recombinase/integrase [Deltaproteobacteria bacterium]|nr:tyrosine-type recombinase/integrase [Deltaproteobacteria bacterium]